MCGCCGCGHVGNASALSKRSAMSTAVPVEAAGYGLTPYRHRRAVLQRHMWASSVVEGDPLGNAGLGLVAVGVALEVDVLVLQRAPQSLDEHIVHPPPASIHRDADFGFTQHADEVAAGKLAALVGVEDLRLAEARQ